MNTVIWKKRLLARWLCPVLCAAAAVLFLAVIYAIAYHNTDLWNLWLPASPNNDEVIYNRQVAGVVSGGQPKGVFGYNETRATVGHFGAWGPVLILLYGIPGVLFGSGVNMMFWCNVLFAVVGWTIFAVGAGLSWRKQLIFAVAFALAWQPAEQVFSGSAEASQNFLIFCILGGTIALQRNFRRGWFWGVEAACAIITVVRAYTVILWIFPVVFLWKKHRKYAWASVGMAAVSLVGYLVVTLLCNAPYLDVDVLDFGALTLLAQGDPLDAVVYQCQRIFGQMQVLWNTYLASSFARNPTQQAIAFWLLLGIELVTLASIVIDVRRSRPVGFRVCALLCTVGSQLIMLAFYTPDPLVRHYMMLFVLLLAAFVYESRLSLAMLVPVILLQLWLPLTLWATPLPTYDATVDAQIQTVQSALQQSVDSCESTDTWDYTLTYAWVGELFHGYLYAVPDGMGIQFDTTAYLADPNHKINSRYVMTHHGSKTEKRLLQQDWHQLVSTQDVVVYQRPEEELQ